MKTALVIGATGLVGTHLVKQLEDTAFYQKVIVLTRRPVTYTNPKIETRQINFDAPEKELIKADHVFCAIGTTLKKAGSKENQTLIDCEYPAKLAAIAKENGAEKFILVSSVGADPGSGNFYLRTKGKLEEKLNALNFDSLVIIRPSFILGKRNEFRAGEKIGIVVARMLKPLMVGGLKRYRGVNASDIAKKMIGVALSNLKGNVLIQSEDI